CQWQFNGVDIPGATNYVLTIPNVQLSDAGDYSVLITGTTWGSDYAPQALLSVYASGAAFLQSAVLSNNQFQFTVQGVPWRRYIVEASTNLLDWTALKTNLSPYSFVETNATAYDQRFYRAMFVPLP